MLSGAIGQYQVVLTPPFSVALEGEVGVVGDDVAVDILHALLDQRVRELFEHLNGMIVARGMQVVRQFAAGKIRVAASDQDQIAGEASVFVENPAGLDSCARCVVWPNQCQSGRSRKQLGVGSGSEQFVGVLGVND